MRCYECGVGEFVATDVRGTTRRHRALAHVPVTQSVLIRQCTNCGEELLSEEEGAALDAVLEPEYQRLMRAAVETSLGEIKRRTGAPKGVVEKIVHVSQGYFSKLTGAGPINPTLVVGLKALASAPMATLRELAENAGVADRLTIDDAYSGSPARGLVVAEAAPRPFRKPTRNASTRGAAKKTAPLRMDKKAKKLATKVAAKLGRTRASSATTGKKATGGKVQKKSAAKRSPGRVRG